MPETPPLLPDEEEHIACPHCTIQIPAGVSVCPHCQQPVLPEKGPQRLPLFQAGWPAPAVLWERYGKWVKAAGPIFLALVVLFLVYQRWIAYRVTVVENPSLPVQVEEESKGDVVILRGTVTNRGDDIPDLSLRSVGVIAEFTYRDGRSVKKTIFPKAEYRGEGALLRGETGTFEVEGVAKNLVKVVLRSEIVDLGMGRKLIPSRRR
jgi:hypothetical protein